MKSLSKTFILVVLLLIILQSFFLAIKTYSAVDAYYKLHPGVRQVTAKVTLAEISLCINNPPSVNTSGCSSNATEDVLYDCWLNASDINYAYFTFASDFYTMHRAYNNSNDSFFNVSSDGYISFTPTNNEVGNYTIRYTVNDNKDCSNSQSSTLFDLRVINVNDAPYLIENIPSQTITSGEVLHAFYLDDYFRDPENDELNYSVILTSSSFNVEIDSTTSEAVISSSSCDVTGNAMFVAMDPYNATNTSNLITIRCITPEVTPESGEGEGTGEGGGGGSSSICISEYECFDYTQCRKNNTKIQRCVDTEGCEEDVYLSVPCNYETEYVCEEVWKCSDWNKCLPNGTQYRGCEDSNNCGTQKKIPVLVQACDYIGTCDDGIKNCHDGSCEEGVDCGGPCATCKSIEVPYPFKEEKGILIYVITGIILLLLAAILIYHYFRKEINSALAKAGWIIKRRKKKQVLLSAEDKKKLLAGLKDLESKLDKTKLFEILARYSVLLRTYLIKACGEGLGAEFELEDLKKLVSRKKFRVVDVLRKVFTLLFSKYLRVEHNKEQITKRNLVLLIEELRNLVLQTSVAEASDAAREVKEFSVPDKVSAVEKTVIMLTNAYIALEFLELEVAKKKYLELLAEYEKLDVKEQEAVFEDIARLYHSISYVNSWLAKPKEE